MKRIIKRINAEFTLFTWSCWSWSCHIHHQKCFPILQFSKQNVVFGGWTKIKYCTPLTGRLSPQCMSVKITTIWSCFQVKKSFYRRVVLLTARLFCNIIPQDKANIYDMMIGALAQVSPYGWISDNGQNKRLFTEIKKYWQLTEM